MNSQSEENLSHITRIAYAGKTINFGIDNKGNIWYAVTGSDISDSPLNATKERDSHPITSNPGHPEIVWRRLETKLLWPTMASAGAAWRVQKRVQKLTTYIAEKLKLISSYFR